jgi:hypothetical protein
LKEKRRGTFTKGVLFLHDNAPAHGALATQKNMVYLGFQGLVFFLVGLRTYQHPLYVHTYIHAHISTILSMEP